MSAWQAAPFLAVPLGVGLASAALSGPMRSEWYDGLRKPAWTPPPWAFAPVWTALYLAMGYASYRVWRAGGHLGLYAVQLALNFAWSVLFFRARSPALATADIAALLVAAGATAVQFGRVDALAGRLMAPYVAWVAYASTLSAGVVALN